ncbi:polyphenol oxidase [Musa troglodytarum]|uniref:Polyphenol oxidase n=1 Tax=Musa troglodytarum TaxID=320322 RepID=A0A9E7H9U5_9LILI|nr:polyphenol oxidase [Musa troglodytarum]
MPPDLSKCHDAKAPALHDHCCPPYDPSETISEYGFPATPLRVRRPAHLVKDDQEYLDKYKEAVRRMKNLPAEHPWNYYQQANIHCQYCNDAYYQQNTDDVPVQVHFSWIFLPWHRYYLHFYERILGKLIDDDTFTIPFWNWDTKEGMTFPAIFQDASSPLYDPKRDQRHVKDGAILDLKYAYTDNPASDSEIIRENLCFIQKTFKYSLSLAELFMGDPVRAGEKEIQEANGQLEVIHNAAHMWVGEPDGYKEDMGDFSTAARDSVFYCHHSNVDRMWDIYRNLRGNQVEFEDKDWLDSTFLFHDENEQLVKVKASQMLSPIYTHPCKCKRNVVYTTVVYCADRGLPQPDQASVHVRASSSPMVGQNQLPEDGRDEVQGHDGAVADARRRIRDDAPGTRREQPAAGDRGKAEEEPQEEGEAREGGGDSDQGY